jgi:predicted DNA-binding transcriptional regulator AlpA
MAATERRERLLDHLAYPPRGMDVEHAASYVGLGRTKFLEMVEAGLMPRPVDLDGSPRWDRLDVDRAFEDLKEQRHDPRKAGRARIQARLDQQKREATQ